MAADYSDNLHGDKRHFRENPHARIDPISSSKLRDDVASLRTTNAATSPSRRRELTSLNEKEKDLVILTRLRVEARKYGSQAEGNETEMYDEDEVTVDGLADRPSARTSPAVRPPDVGIQAEADGRLAPSYIFYDGAANRSLTADLHDSATAPSDRTALAMTQSPDESTGARLAFEPWNRRAPGPSRESGTNDELPASWLGIESSSTGSHRPRLPNAGAEAEDSTQVSAVGQQRLRHPMSNTGSWSPLSTVRSNFPPHSSTATNHQSDLPEVFQESFRGKLGPSAAVSDIAEKNAWPSSTLFEDRNMASHNVNNRPATTNAPSESILLHSTNHPSLAFFEQVPRQSRRLESASLSATQVTHTSDENESLRLSKMRLDGTSVRTTEGNGTAPSTTHLHGERSTNVAKADEDLPTAADDLLNQNLWTAAECSGMLKPSTERLPKDSQTTLNLTELVTPSSRDLRGVLSATAGRDEAAKPSRLLARHFTSSVEQSISVRLPVANLAEDKLSYARSNETSHPSVTHFDDGDKKMTPARRRDTLEPSMLQVSAENSRSVASRDDDEQQRNSASHVGLYDGNQQYADVIRPSMSYLLMGHAQHDVNCPPVTGCCGTCRR
jgi:hypothetical protein